MRHFADQRTGSLCFLDMLGVFVEFETYLRRGASLKEYGCEGGRHLQRAKANIDTAKIKQMKADGGQLMHP
jgi:hypothetical protein